MTYDAVDSSSDDEPVPVIHFPGSSSSHKRTGSSYARPDLARPARPRSPTLKVKTRKRRKHEYRQGTSSVVVARQPPTNQLALARQARSNFSLLSHLGAGRIDPFNVYVQQDLPVYVHHMLDHAINTACKAYVPSEKTVDMETVRAQLMDEIMNVPLAWYSIIMASITHHAFISGHTAVPEKQQLLRLSYQTKTVALIQDDMRERGGLPSDVGMIGIATLIVHGGSVIDQPFVHDKVQTRKAFGTANDMHYYSAIELDHSHWRMLARFVQQRGGPSTIKIKAMAMVLASGDALTAWRTLSKPILDQFVPTSLAIMFAPHRPDDLATAQFRKMLSGLPLGFRTSTEAPFATLYEAMQHMRTLIVRFNQWQRRRGDRGGWRPDLRQIHLTRLLLMHDLLSLDALDMSGGGGRSMNLTYELTRHASLAFMQLVLFPVAQNNDMPNRLLTLTVPLLERARAQLREADVDVEVAVLKKSAAAAVRTAKGNQRADPDAVNAGLGLWVWMLAGMLALEHLQTKGNSDWMDQLAPLIEDMPIKAEKQMWPLVRGVMETFMWLGSECDSLGRQWWNYACLWMQARRADMENVEEGERQVEIQRQRQRQRPKWALNAERIHAAVAEIPVVEID